MPQRKQPARQNPNSARMNQRAETPVPRRRMKRRKYLPAPTSGGYGKGPISLTGIDSSAPAMATRTRANELLPLPQWLRRMPCRSPEQAELEWTDDIIATAWRQWMFPVPFNRLALRIPVWLHRQFIGLCYFDRLPRLTGVAIISMISLRPMQMEIPFPERDHAFGER